MTIPLRVLILEDRPADAELLALQLRQAGFDPEWQRVETEEEYLAALHPALDIILSDYSLPQFDGLSAVRLLRARGLDIPFILVSGTIGEDIAAESIKQGADDYLLKDRLARLGQAVAHALEQKRLRDERRQAEEALRKKDEHHRAVIESIFKFVPEGVLVLTESLNLLKHNKAFDDILQKYAPRLGYAEQELADEIIQQLRSKILGGENTEIRVPKKSK